MRTGLAGTRPRHRMLHTRTQATTAPTLMPSRPARICTTCRNTIQGTRCTTCQSRYNRRTDQTRGNSTARGYGSHWRRVIRPAFLQANPLCCLCGALAEVPDHWPVTRAQLIADHVPDPDAFHRMRPLCLTCHARHGLTYRR